jgi:hypothetical protein
MVIHVIKKQNPNLKDAKKIWPCSFQQKTLAKFKQKLLIFHIEKYDFCFGWEKSGLIEKHSLFAFLQQILDFQLTQNSTHLVDYYPSNIPSNFLSNGFVVSDKDIFFLQESK